METPHTVLVVEDNDFVRVQMVTFLKSAGYNTLEATEGQAALGVINKDVSLAVVDVIMEPMGGLEFVERMQAAGYKVPVMLVTGDQDTNLLENAAKLGVATIMLKPLQKDKFIFMVGNLIEKNAH